VAKTANGPVRAAYLGAQRRTVRRVAPLLRRGQNPRRVCPMKRAAPVRNGSSCPARVRAGRRSTTSRYLLSSLVRLASSVRIWSVPETGSASSFAVIEPSRCPRKQKSLCSPPLRRAVRRVPVPLDRGQNPRCVKKNHSALLTDMQEARLPQAKAADHTVRA
jgi:hypothetical protein